MKKLIKLLFACFLAFGLCGCGESIEDTNGENNTALNTITKEDILSNSISASGLGTEEGEFLGFTSFKYKAKNFNGVEELYNENYLFSTAVYVHVNFINLKSGNFRMFVINDGKIIQEIPSDATGESYCFENLDGNLTIRVAGESAKVEFDFDVQ